MPAILLVVTSIQKHGMLFASTGRTTNHLKVAKKCYFTDFGNFASDTAGGNIHKKARLALWLIWPVPAHKFRRYSKKSLTATSPPVNSRKNPFSVVNYSFLPVVSFLLVLNINLRSLSVRGRCNNRPGDIDSIGKVVQAIKRRRNRSANRIIRPLCCSALLISAPPLQRRAGDQEIIEYSTLCSKNRLFPHRWLHCRVDTRTDRLHCIIRPLCCSVPLLAKEEPRIADQEIIEYSQLYSKNRLFPHR